MRALLHEMAYKYCFFITLITVVSLMMLLFAGIIVNLK